MKVKRYKSSMIPGYGPKEDKMYYYDLASIGNDYAKNFKKECEKEKRERIGTRKKGGRRKT